MSIIHFITDYEAPELDVFARASENMLAHYDEPRGGIFVAESPKVIARALAAGYEPISFLVETRYLPEAGISEGKERKPLQSVTREKGGSMADSGKDGSAYREVGELLAACPDVPVYAAEPKLLMRIIGYKLTRGIFCAMKRRKLPTAAELLKEAQRIAVLVNVENPTNLGAIFRSAAALGIDAVLLTEDCCDPLYRRAARVSVGTVFQIPWTYLSAGREHPPRRLPEILAEFGFASAAFALGKGSVSITDPALKNTERLALLLGNEGDGLPEDILAGCHHHIRIPMREGVDSLNVAAAAAIAFWELGRLRGLTGTS